MLNMLPTDTTIVGIDEQTSLLLDLQQPSECCVFGRGIVTILRQGEQRTINSGESFPIDALGPFKAPERVPEAIQGIWSEADKASRDKEAPPPKTVLELSKQRETARREENWAVSDHLRKQIEVLGWSVNDTPNGPQLTRL